MCGIAGYITRKNKFKVENLKLMTNCLQHRGPDCTGTFVSENGQIGIGHTRLSILDLSEAANQPFFSKCRRYVMVYNGEVYNYRTIARDLKLELNTTGDTEVILEAFVKLGPRFVNKLNGMFTIVIYDIIENQIHFFRDRIGIKPLYIYKDNELILFASELKSIQSLKDKITLSVNYEALNTFLHLGYIPEEMSCYNNVTKFPSGNYGKITKSFDLLMKPYWEPEKHICSSILTNESEAKIQLDQLLNDSISKRLVSDVPFGTFLSGGIDSSLVTAIASNHTNKSLKTFSIGFKEGMADESKYAAQVAKYLGTDHTEYILPVEEAIHMVPAMLNTYDEPFADSSAIPTMLVSSLAKKEVTMVLTGDGGDELFHGYGMYDWAQRIALTPHIFKPMIKFVLSKGSNRYKRAAMLFEQVQNQHVREHIFSQEQYLFSRSEIDLLTKIDNKTIYEFPISITARKLTEMESQGLFDLKHYLKDDLLVKVDRASMKYSLEARVPLLDYRIVEFALNLDPKLKVKNGEKKYLLKSILYDYVPKSYFDRPKGGFNVPLSQWIKKDLNYLISDNLNSELLKAIGYFNTEHVENLVNRFEKGQDFLYNRIWALIQVSHFLQKLI